VKGRLSVVILAEIAERRGERYYLVPPSTPDDSDMDRRLLRPPFAPGAAACDSKPHLMRSSTLIQRLVHGFLAGEDDEQRVGE
jgi:hypothetical protein